jgi:hypothetical protein
MIFSVEPSRLLDLMEANNPVGDRGQKSVGTVRLLACEGNVWLEGEGMRREMDALVWEGGQCVVSARALAHSLRDFATESCVTVSCDVQGLCIRGEMIPVLRYCSWALPPGVAAEAAATD